jgi:hypothetical protein
VWGVNEVALVVLISMRTQLRRSGMNGRVQGLDYQPLPWVMQQLGILPTDTAEVFRRLQWAEDELVNYCNSGSSA